MRRLTWLLLALAACSSNPRLGVPPEVSDGDALVFYVAVEDAAPVIFASQVEGEDVVVPIDLEPGQRVETELAVYDDRTLEELQIEPGLAALVEDGAPLPEPDGHYTITVDGPPSGAPFEPIAWSDSRLSEARFARSAKVCLDAGRCLTETSVCVACENAIPVDPPEPPEPPELRCPQGWSVNTLRSEPTAIQICDPRTESSRLDCPNGSSRPLGASECVPVGRACPGTGRFAEGATGWFVDSTAAAGGDGSRAAPYRALGDALAVAAAGDTILLSVGDHDFAGAVSDLGLVDRLVTIRGACAAQTTLNVAAAIDASDVYVAFEDVRIEAPDGLWSGSAGRLEITGADLRLGGATTPIAVTGGELVIREVVADASPGFVEVTSGTSTIASSVIRAVGGNIVGATGGVSSSLLDSVLIGGDRTFPLFRVDDVPFASVARVAFEDAAWSAIHAEGGGGISIADIFYETESGVRFTGVYAIAANDLGVRIQRAWLQGALGLLHFGADLEITDVVVNPDGAGTVTDRAPAVQLRRGTQGYMRRVVLYGVHRQGIYMLDSSVSLADLRIDDLRAEANADYSGYVGGAVGILLHGEPEIQLMRVALVGVEGVAIAQIVREASIGRSLQIVDLDVRGAGPTDCFAPVGGFVAGATNYTLTRARFEDIRGPAMSLNILGGDGVPSFITMEATHVSMARVTPIPGCPAGPTGILLAEGSELDIDSFDLGVVDGPAIEVRPNSINAVDATLLDAQHGRIHDVPVGVRYRVVDPRLHALVDVRIEPNAGGVALDLGGI